MRRLNPELEKIVGANDDVAVPPGLVLTIPDPAPKFEVASPNQRNVYQVTVGRRYLRLTLRDEYGKPLSGWSYWLEINGERVGADIDVDAATLTTRQPIPTSLQRIELRLAPNQKTARAPEKILLHIAGMETLAGPDGGRRAAQKILTNLGIYRGPIDGNLDAQDEHGDRASRRALMEFQNSSGIIPARGQLDQQTCERLIQAQGNLLLPPHTPEQMDILPTARDHALEGFVEADSVRIYPVEGGDEYLEPTEEDMVTPRKTDPGDRFPHEAFVALCEKGAETKNPNVVRKSPSTFIFLDTGAWLYQKGDMRFFGLIWGRHVYLCEYVPAGGKTEDVIRRTGLDATFFAAMRDRVRVVARASATWAPAADFAWDRLYLVLPDLHLMTGRNSAVWKPTGVGTFGHPEYNLQPELDLLRFAQLIVAIDELRGKIKAVQIGDAYDLWLGLSPAPRELAEARAAAGLPVEGDVPLFRPNDDRLVALISPQASAIVAGWLQDIQGRRQVDEKDSRFWNLREKTFDVGNWVKRILIDRDLSNAEVDALELELRRTERPELWLNPAQRALELLEQHCDLAYVYGNHDNYLLLPEVIEEPAIRLRPRMRHIEAPGVFMEHGHRIEAMMERRAIVNVPRNYDGATSGYDAALKVYRQYEREKGDWWTRAKEWVGTLYGEVWQKEICDEFGRLWWARRASEDGAACPHIFVVGHTHHPRLLFLHPDRLR